MNCAIVGKIQDLLLFSLALIWLNIVLSYDRQEG